MDLIKICKSSLALSVFVINTMGEFLPVEPKNRFFKEFQSSFCENLYCHKNDTLSECVWVAPAAEGTECGSNMWCQKGKCLPKNLFQNKGRLEIKVLS